VLAFVAALAVGIALLAYAADQFVVGAARLAGILRISPVVIGAVVVGFGTSAPEILVSGIAAAQDDLDVGVGNVIGSNVANLTLILGAAALLLPLTVRSGILKREAPLSVASVFVFAIFLLGGFQLWEGVVLVVLLAGALFLLVRGPGGDDTELVAEVLEEFEVTGHRLPPESVRTLVGLIGTVAGAWALVWGAQGMADRFGLSGGFVGVSLIAVGTSLPELVTAIAAARHREQELVIGNLLGSNLFNSLAVGGLIAVLAPGVEIDESLRTVGVGFMVAVALVALVLMVTKACVDRIEGGLLLVAFVVFLVVSYLTQPDAVEALAGAVVGWL
jgi:cation:H+ antiporter